MYVRIALAIVLCTGQLYASSSEDIIIEGSLSRYLAEYGCHKPVLNRTSVIEDCLKRALHFFRKYLSRLDKGKQYDVCRRFEDVQICLEPILAVCPSFKEKYSNILMPVTEYFRCACSDQATCMENLHCFEVEYRGILSRRCDDYYKFNIEQKTHDQCFFLQENIACKVSLVTTACDGKTGIFAFNLYRFLALHDTKTSHCDVRYVNTEEYEGFYYDANCPTYFLQDLASCSTNHLWKQMLAFDEENDLIAKGSREDVRTSCSAYKNYRKCIRHPRKACKKGTGEVFNYGVNLRKYALKMNYICRNDNKKEYIKSLSCYQDVLHNETLRGCNYIYKDLNSWLKSVSAFQFYCKQTSEDTISMKRQLDRLRSCYHRVFESRCGQRAGHLMGELIALAFQDPAYLRYSFRPDCKLHRKRSRTKPDARRTSTPDSDDGEVSDVDGSVAIESPSASTCRVQRQVPVVLLTLAVRIFAGEFYLIRS